MLSEIVYFDKTGKENTRETLDVVKKKALQLGIKKVLIASTTGYTALCAAEAFQSTGVDIVAVGIDTYGWSQEEAKRKELESKGIRLVPCSIYFNDEVSNILRCFSQGVKVAVEIAVMAAEAGAVQESDRVIAVAGTGFGADTSLLLKPARKRTINKLEIYKILCMPGKSGIELGGRL